MTTVVQIFITFVAFFLGMMPGYYIGFMHCDYIEKERTKNTSASMKEQSHARIGEETRSTKAQFDVALFTKEYDRGLTKDEIRILLDMLPENEEVIPLEIQGSANNLAMGYITNSAGDKIDYEYRPKQGFHTFVISILNDKDKRSSDGIYAYKGLKVFLF